MLSNMLAAYQAILQQRRKRGLQVVAGFTGKLQREPHQSIFKFTNVSYQRC